MRTHIRNKECSPSLRTLSCLTAATIGRQKVGYGTVVDGFAKFQALNFGISGPEISEGLSF